MPRFSASHHTSSAIPSAPSHASSGVHSRRNTEAHLWCHQRQAGPSGIREVQDRLAGLSGRGQRMGKQFLTRRADSITSGAVRESCTRPMPSRASTLLPQGDQERRFPQRGMQSSRFSTYASKSSIKNGRGRHVANQKSDGPEPAAHGRQDVSAYAAIRCCLLNRFTQNS